MRSVEHIVVCVATTGRPKVLTETLRDLALQTRAPDRVIVCPAKLGDIDDDAVSTLPLPIEIVAGGHGLAAQRNVLLEAAGAADAVLFIDDDFLLSPTYVAELGRLFAERPDCVIATGHVLADGATNRGYGVDEGRRIIAEAAVATGKGSMEPARVEPVFNAYGCNMAVRWSHLRERNCRFDERLPLYAWAEDVDFSRQAAAFGSVLKSHALTGVHLAAKTGRVSGVRFGYSQIANQLYLVRKGTITLGGGLRKMGENIAANLVGSLHGAEPFIDRRGRLLGNLYGLRDVVIGRSSPGRILDM